MTALVRVNGAAGRKQAWKVIEALELGSLTNLSGDGPRAVHVAEVLRAYLEDVATSATRPRVSALPEGGAKGRGRARRLRRDDPDA